MFLWKNEEAQAGKKIEQIGARNKYWWVGWNKGLKWYSPTAGVRGGLVTHVCTYARTILANGTLVSTDRGTHPQSIVWVNSSELLHLYMLL